MKDLIEFWNGITFNVVQRVILVAFSVYCLIVSFGTVADNYDEDLMWLVSALVALFSLLLATKNFKK